MILGYVVNFPSIYIQMIISSCNNENNFSFQGFIINKGT